MASWILRNQVSSQHFIGALFNYDSESCFKIFTFTLQRSTVYYDLHSLFFLFCSTGLENHSRLEFLRQSPKLQPMSIWRSGNYPIEVNDPVQRGENAVPLLKHILLEIETKSAISFVFFCCTSM